jgi:hypothetical protein
LVLEFCLRENERVGTSVPDNTKRAGAKIIAPERKRTPTSKGEKQTLWPKTCR